MEVIRTSGDRKKSKFDLGLTLSKYFLLLLNVTFVISSIFMMSGGISAYLIFERIYSDMGDAFRMLSIFWLVVGIVLMFVALFGLVVAFKENVVLANLYGIAMLLVFLSQISAIIADFTLISRTRGMVSEQLDHMIRNYDSHYYEYDYRQTMDWIQSKYECCGNNEASDWQTLQRYWDTHYNVTDFMPASCCDQYSNYVNMTCDRYHRIGCFEPIHQLVSESIMTIGSSAIVYSILQILGVMMGFKYGRIIRRKKTQRDVQIWNSGQEYSAMSNSLPANYY